MQSCLIERASFQRGTVKIMRSHFTEFIFPTQYLAWDIACQGVPMSHTCFLEEGLHSHWLIHTMLSIK